ncbi:MAG: sigma-54 dependent transcriptional regulator [Gemmatimonadota bacterium]
MRLLLIDDDEVVRRTVGAFLTRMGHRVIDADSGRRGLALFDAEAPDLIISDVRMPDLGGIELLRALKERDAAVEVILITGHGDMETAIQALREGAFDFFNKPVRLEDLAASLERTRRFQALRRERDQIRARLESLERSDAPRLDDAMVGESQAMRRVAELVAKVAATERTTVLIRGESGTGKELVARAIHRRSPRSEAPFVSINCTAVPDTLFESELFGHEKGAFTDARTTRQGLFEVSHGGTLLLDEVADMSPASQAKILRVLEERHVRRVGGVREIPVDVRLIAATNQDLGQLQEDGGFRPDLFFRLNVFTIQLPPLRERGDDVLLLAHHFLSRYAREFRKEIRGIDPSAQEVLAHYPFPGNVRELRNLMERAVILSEGPALGARDFSDLRAGAPPHPSAEAGGSLDLAALEERAIRQALARSSQNQRQAAELLGIGPDALRYRMGKYGLA